MPDRSILTETANLGKDFTNKELHVLICHCLPPLVISKHIFIKESFEIKAYTMKNSSLIATIQR